MVDRRVAGKAAAVGGTGVAVEGAGQAGRTLDHVVVGQALGAVRAGGAAEAVVEAGVGCGGVGLVVASLRDAPSCAESPELAAVAGETAAVDGACLTVERAGLAGRQERVEEEMDVADTGGARL